MTPSFPFPLGRCCSFALAQHGKITERTYRRQACRTHQARHSTDASSGTRHPDIEWVSCASIPTLPLSWPMSVVVGRKHKPFDYATLLRGYTLNTEIISRRHAALGFTSMLFLYPDGDRRGFGLPCAEDRDCFASRGLFCENWICGCAPGTPVKVEVNGIDKCFRGKRHRFITAGRVASGYCRWLARAPSGMSHRCSALRL